jgi:hypothetical protein
MSQLQLKVQDKNEKSQDFFQVYPFDVIEIFIAITIIQAILDKPINFQQVLKSSLVIGILIFIAQNISNDFRNNVKNGIQFSLGGFMMNQFTSVGI